MKIIARLSSQPFIGEDRQLNRLKAIVYERYRVLKIEPQEPKNIDRLIRSAVSPANNRSSNSGSAPFLPPPTFLFRSSRNVLQ